MNRGKRKWWEDMEPKHKSEGDGQTQVWTYVREVSAHSFEFALVTYSDDGEYQGAMIINEEFGRFRFVGNSSLK